MTAIIFSRSIGPVPIDCMVREQPRLGLGISEIPIESGAKITDHAYIEPKRVRLEFAAGAGAAAFAPLVAFQESRIPFTVVTGLYVYPNMLIGNLEADRSSEWSNILYGYVELQEAIIVETTYTASEEGDAVSDGQPGGKNSTRSATPTSSRAGDPATSARSTGPTSRSDITSRRVPATQSKSILSSVTGG